MGARRGAAIEKVVLLEFEKYDFICWVSAKYHNIFARAFGAINVSLKLVKNVTKLTDNFSAQSLVDCQVLLVLPPTEKFLRAAMS